MKQYTIKGVKEGIQHNDGLMMYIIHTATLPVHLQTGAGGIWASVTLQHICGETLAGTLLACWLPGIMPAFPLAHIGTLPA